MYMFLYMYCIYGWWLLSTLGSGGDETLTIFRKTIWNIHFLLYSAIYLTCMALCTHLAAAVSVSCQQQGITSTLREGNRTCQGEEVIFTCTLRDSSSLGFEWRSPGYIADGSPLQFPQGSMIGVDASSVINGRTTAIATLTNNTIDNGVHVLVTTLRITAVEPSTVICSGTNEVTLSIEFSVSGTCSTLCETIAVST